MPRPNDLNRRDVLRLAGVGGVVFASGLAGCASRNGPAGSGVASDFFFMQLTDTHWGYTGPANPESDVTLKQAIAVINASPVQPDFIVFTGDLTHTTDDPALRRQRLMQFKDIVGTLAVKDLRFLAGEHDASLDLGAAFQDIIGPLHHSFDHKGVHFVALDNVSDPKGAVGTAQLAWLASDLKSVADATPIVVFAHRPLFDLYPDWDWATADGAAVVQALQAKPNVTVFYGHIHQEHHHMTGAIAHHAARSLIFPLPAPGSQPMRAPLPWNPASPDHGLGYRQVARAAGAFTLTEIPYKGGAATPDAGNTTAAVVKITASRWQYTPSAITLKLGVPVVLEVTSTDVHHGFTVPSLGIRADIVPGAPQRIAITPTTAGTFPFHCDVFCGDGHEGMAGQLVVEP